ncbi:MAG: hypothetical protein EOM37_05160 [Proteobacteria bacterium]|jgi:tetratricopeptide (TPR) repeat protein|nr:hypothetical protein [Alphaproteobacteria bacterium]NCC03421.1 hypothetical protein [Pseudomonadota bacterium]
MAYAQTPAKTESVAPTALVMRTGEHPTYDRIVFDAPRGLKYRIVRKEGRVEVLFSRDVRVALGKADLQRAKGFRAGAGNGGRVVFYIDPKAQIKDFMSGSSIVIDVMGARLNGPTPVAEPEESTQKPVPQVEAVKPASVPEIKKGQEPEKKVEVPHTSGKEPEKVAEKVADTPKAEAKTPLPELASRPHVSVSGPVAPTPQAAPIVKVEEVAQPAPPSPEVSKWPPEIQNPMDAKEVDRLRAIADEQQKEPIVELDPKMVVGAVIYLRAGYATILFDRKLEGDALKMSPKSRVKLEPMTLPKNNGFRIRLPQGLTVQATRQDTAWKMYLARQSEKNLVSTELDAQPDFALGARIFLPASPVPEPIRFVDPVVGDELIVVPLQESGGYTVGRRMANFQIIPAVQGLVIKPWQESVVVRPVAGGLEISAEGGLKLSSLHDTSAYVRNKKQVNGVEEKRAFDILQWRGTQNETFTQRRQRLWQSIVEVPKDQRILAKLDLARFYFANMMGYEASTLCDMIAVEMPEIQGHAEFLMLRGASRILMGNLQGGLGDLNNSVVKEQMEISLWRGVAEALQHNWQASVELMRVGVPILSHYPEPMHTRFWVLAIESAIAAGQDKDAIEWLNTLEKEGYQSESRPAVQYLRGVVYSKAGQIDLAEKMWRKVAKGKDRLYKIRAELALVDMGVATGSTTAKQAIERLEGMRFAWRGDDLELDILRRLGGFYISDMNFKKGFVTYFEALRLYPDVPHSQEIRKEMVRLFLDIFLTKTGDQLSPLEALDIYTKYKVLIPKGSEGNPVRENLAQRLVDIDLLDQAIVLFEDIAVNTDKPEEKAQVAMRIAGIYLLDHKSKEALAQIDANNLPWNTLSQSTKDSRQLLRARALSEMGKYEEALGNLPANQNQETLLLRADIALRAKAWKDAHDALIELVGPPPAQGKRLTDNQATWLVQAAIATAMTGNFDGLDKMALDYGPAMDNTQQANVFRILTRPEEGTQMKDLQAAQSMVSEVDVFRDVLDSFRKGSRK